MSSVGGFQRVISMFIDKDLEHEDVVNPLFVLGDSYEAKKEDEDNLQDSGGNVTDVKEETPLPGDEDHRNDSLVIVEGDIEQQKHNIDKQDSTINSQFANLQINNITQKIQSNFSSFFHVNNNSSTDVTSQKLSNSNLPQLNTVKNMWPKDFLDDVKTRIWLTYRVGFPSIPKDKNSPSTVMGALMRGNFSDINSDGFSTDCGWGCMIRTSQSLLANGLLNLHAGRDWRFSNSNDNLMHDKLITWFTDDPKSPFSIHKFVQKGHQLSGKSSGEWFGPSAASRSIQALCEEFESANLKAFIGEDSGEIYEKDLLEKLEENSHVLILLGIRLGVDNINEIYYPAIKQVLSISQSAGIAGGRPSSSHYFFGYQGDYLFFLDPHISNRPALNNEQLDIDSVHTTRFNKLHLSEMDPSMLIGFLIKDKEDFDQFKSSVNESSLKKIIHIVTNTSKKEMFNSQMRKSSLDVLTERTIVLVESDPGMGDEFVDLGGEFDSLSQEFGEQRQNEDYVSLKEKPINQSTWETVSNHNASYEDLVGEYQKQEEEESKVLVADSDDDSEYQKPEESKVFTVSSSEKSKVFVADSDGDEQ